MNPLTDAPTPAPPPAATENRGELRADRVIETIDRLQLRIQERFPGSGLGQVCAELRRVAEETASSIPILRQPIWPLRVAAYVGAAALIASVAWFAVTIFRATTEVGSAAEVLQGADAAVNVLIFLSIAIFFLVGLEARVKRRRVLRAVQQLRSIVHIVDMHQLTKDPDLGSMARIDTASSPRRVLGRYELSRYLDYCSEMLSLSSKLAALHVQYVNDPVVLDAVNDIETLASSLSSKIWQKIMILDQLAVGESYR